MSHISQSGHCGKFLDHSDLITAFKDAILRNDDDTLDFICFFIREDLHFMLFKKPCNFAVEFIPYIFDFATKFPFYPNLDIQLAFLYLLNSIIVHQCVKKRKSEIHFSFDKIYSFYKKVKDPNNIKTFFITDFSTSVKCLLKNASYYFDDNDVQMIIEKYMHKFGTRVLLQSYYSCQKLLNYCPPSASPQIFPICAYIIGSNNYSIIHFNNLFPKVIKFLIRFSFQTQDSAIFDWIPFLPLIFNGALKAFDLKLNLNKFSLELKVSSKNAETLSNDYGVLIGYLLSSDLNYCSSEELKQKNQEILKNSFHSNQLLTTISGILDKPSTSSALILFKQLLDIMRPGFHQHKQSIYISFLNGVANGFNKRIIASTKGLIKNCITKEGINDFIDVFLPTLAASAFETDFGTKLIANTFNKIIHFNPQSFIDHIIFPALKFSTDSEHSQISDKALSILAIFIGSHMNELIDHCPTLLDIAIQLISSGTPQRNGRGYRLFFLILKTIFVQDDCKLGIKQRNICSLIIEKFPEILTSYYYYKRSTLKEPENQDNLFKDYILFSPKFTLNSFHYNLIFTFGSFDYPTITKVIQPILNLINSNSDDLKHTYLLQRIVWSFIFVHPQSIPEFAEYTFKKLEMELAKPCEEIFNEKILFWSRIVASCCITRKEFVPYASRYMSIIKTLAEKKFYQSVLTMFSYLNFSLFRKSVINFSQNEVSQWNQYFLLKDVNPEFYSFEESFSIDIMNQEIEIIKNLIDDDKFYSYTLKDQVYIILMFRSMYPLLLLQKVSSSFSEIIEKRLHPAVTPLLKFFTDSMINFLNPDHFSKLSFTVHHFIIFSLISCLAGIILSDGSYYIQKLFEHVKYLNDHVFPRIEAPFNGKKAYLRIQALIFFQVQETILETRISESDTKVLDTIINAIKLIFHSFSKVDIISLIYFLEVISHYDPSLNGPIFDIFKLASSYLKLPLDDPSNLIKINSALFLSTNNSSFRLPDEILLDLLQNLLNIDLKKMPNEFSNLFISILFKKQRYCYPNISDSMSVQIINLLMKSTNHSKQRIANAIRNNLPLDISLLPPEVISMCLSSLCDLSDGNATSYAFLLSSIMKRNTPKKIIIPEETSDPSTKTILYGFFSKPKQNYTKQYDFSNPICSDFKKLFKVEMVSPIVKQLMTKNFPPSFWVELVNVFHDDDNIISALSKSFQEILHSKTEELNPAIYSITSVLKSIFQVMTKWPTQYYENAAKLFIQPIFKLFLTLNTIPLISVVLIPYMSLQNAKWFNDLILSEIDRLKGEKDSQDYELKIGRLMTYCNVDRINYGMNFIEIYDHFAELISPFSKHMITNVKLFCNNFLFTLLSISHIYPDTILTEEQITTRMEKLYEPSNKGTFLYKIAVKTNSTAVIPFLMKHLVEIASIELPLQDEVWRTQGIIQMSILPWNEFALNSGYLDLLFNTVINNLDSSNWSVRLFLISLIYGTCFIYPFLIPHTMQRIKNEIIQKMIVDPDSSVRDTAIRFYGLLLQSSSIEDRNIIIEQTLEGLNQKKPEAIFTAIVILDILYITAGENDGDGVIDYDNDAVVPNWVPTLLESLEYLYNSKNMYMDKIGKVANSFWQRHRNIRISQIEDYRYSFSNNYYA